MFLYLGGNISVKKSDVIGIFDIDNVNTQKTTKDFLHTAEQEGTLLLVGEDLPKSFLLVGEKQNAHTKTSKEQVFLCRLSARSLYGRACRESIYDK